MSNVVLKADWIASVNQIVSINCYVKLECSVRLISCSASLMADILAATTLEQCQQQRWFMNELASILADSTRIYEMIRQVYVAVCHRSLANTLQ